MRSNFQSSENVVPGSASCTAIVCITGYRPKALGRCLRALRPGAASGAARFVVLDRDSERPGSFPAGLALTPSDRYLPLRQTRERLVTYLAGHGIDAAVARFAVSGTPESTFDPGANRNTLLLLTAGECVVSVDDDVVPVPLVSRRDPQRLIIKDEGDPRENWFDCDERSLTPVEYSLLAAIEAMLGHRTLDRHVRAVVPGLVGDHALMAASFLLLQDTSSVRRLCETEVGYRAAVTSRRILRCVDGPAISRGAAFMTTCYGYTNTDCGVPFSPNHANEDALFGAMIRLADPRACTGYIPEVVRHVPVETRGFALEAVREPVPLRIAHVLAQLLATGQIGDPVDPAAWCHRAGDALVQLSLEPAAGFRARIAAAVDQIWARDLSRASAVLDARPAWPPWLERDLEALRTAIARDRGRALDDQLCDCPDLASAQRYVGEFGRLVACWPEMWALFASLSPAGKDALVRGS